jgi:competence protein ComEC
VVATHADADHRGGLPAVVAALPVDGVWLPPGGRSDPDFTPLREAARRRGVPVEEVASDAAPLQLGDLAVQVLWPPSSGPRLASRNEASLALRIEVEGRRVLLLGDLGAAEAELLRSGRDLTADVLLLPHHGSGGSSSIALLRAVAPQVALVSAPCPAQRGLPNPDALTRARDAGASLWWTGRDGALFVGLGGRLVAAPFGSPRRCERSHAPPDAPDQRSMLSTSRS